MADIIVVSTGAYKAALDEILARFLATSKFQTRVVYESAAAVGKRLEAGEAVDVAISSNPVMEALVGKSLIAAGSLQPAGQNAVCVAYKAGTEPPTVATLAELAGVLVNVESISLSDPALGGGSAGFFLQKVKALGMTEAVLPKLVYTKGGQGAVPVAEGRAVIGIAQTSEIAPLPGLAAAPLLPDEPAGLVTYQAGLTPGAREGAAALLAFMRGKEALEICRKAGLSK
jgi:molybdate transport system substrate-binding protein